MDFFAFATMNAGEQFGGYVTARRTIEQSPLADAPAVPRGTRGHIDDYDDPLLIVDFGEPYGAIICDPSDVEIGHFIYSREADLKWKR